MPQVTQGVVQESAFLYNERQIDTSVLSMCRFGFCVVPARQIYVHGYTSTRAKYKTASRVIVYSETFP